MSSNISICEQNGHDWQTTGFTQMIDSVTLEVECECGAVETDTKYINQPTNI